MPLVRVAVPVPALDALTYRVPDGFDIPAIGTRVLVPVGKRVMTGIVVDLKTPDLPDSQPHLVLAGPHPRSLSLGGGAPRRFPPAPRSGRRRSVLPILKDLIDVLDADAFLQVDVVKLALWVAEYYASGPGEALAAAMPPRAWIESERYAQLNASVSGAGERGLRREILERLAGGKPVRVDALSKRGSGIHAALLGLERDGLVTLTQPLKGSADAHRMVRTVHLSAQGQDLEAAGHLGARQRVALDLLRGVPGGIDASHLAARGISSQTIARLAAQGFVTIGKRRVERDPFADEAQRKNGPMELSNEQQCALERLRSLSGQDRFATALLHGVTGSGKTEVYLRLAQEVSARGRGVLILVPEIALTPAVAAIFRATFADRVAIQHSGLSDGERHDQWQRIRRGDVDVVVGTRSAVFAPLKTLGLIVVDEEHDGSYKQEESPRYHARDVAVMRARQAGALAVLGSATPSLESYQNALNGRYELVPLRKRIFDRPLADVRIIDMRDVYESEGPDVILSPALRDALSERLERREQSIVLLNRRGFSTTVFCRQCGSTTECPNCSVSLTVHRAERRARCHYCNYSIGIPKACSNCAGPYLEQMGFGTERVEAEIRAQFPHARAARVDRDTIRRRGAISALLSRFASGGIDVLVGTQMIAKGHDFPRVSLVGVISADVGLGLADFRAAERTFQLLTQVAGRAGRGDIRGQAIIQTLHPAHYSIVHATGQNYEAFFAEESRYRQAMRYPPAVALVNAIVKGRTRQQAMEDAGDLVRALRRGGEPYKVLGPAPAPLSRLRGEYRAQFFMKGPSRTPMRRALQTVLEARPELKRRTTIDVDPMTVL
ncbi:MAG: primosomal protein N' [Vicinamibacterales bacterium]